MNSGETAVLIFIRTSSPMLKGFQVSFYDKEETRIRDEYKKHCHEAVQNVLGLITDKQFGLLFNKAWENGYSSGLHEIAQELEDLTYFILEWKNKERYINEQR